jgi:hypothetical protein
MPLGNDALKWTVISAYPAIIPSPSLKIEDRVEVMINWFAHRSMSIYVTRPRSTRLGFAQHSNPFNAYKSAKYAALLTSLDQGRRPYNDITKP